MERRSEPCKTDSNLSESIHQQLNMHTVGRLLTVVGLFALAWLAEAKIVYTPTHVVVYGGAHNLDLNNDGVADFTILSQFHSKFCLKNASVTETPASGNGVVGAPPAALNLGDQIGTNQTFYQSEGEMARITDTCGHIYHTGNWYNVKNRYLGLSFLVDGKTHYGWARFSVTVLKFTQGIKATLTGYAYETIPGKSIKAGQTKGAADEATNDDFGSGTSLTEPIPDTPHTSLGMLVLGAQGLPPWRWRESVVEGHVQGGLL